MSYQPPPYGSVIPINPDTRPLPEGWIQQYDQNYNTWFYVQTNAKPPITRWTHPLGPVPQYTPPSNNPYSNDMRAFASQPELGRPAPPYEFAEERGRGGGGGGSGSGMSTGTFHVCAFGVSLTV
ncbi:hypothetical protein L208DRAFT_1385923 [Tricholoma matsutake]|nr:hypothetical protein L208DRAFT_1385923 [Tricholoma matsutake 945]